MMNRRGGFGGRSMRDDDFEEEDVWGFVKESKDSSPTITKSKEYSSGSSSSSAWRIHSAPRMIPRVTNNSQTTIEAMTHVQQSSASVDSPDWSNSYDKNARNIGSWVNMNDDHHGNGIADHGGVAYENGHGYDDADVDVDDGMVPPHEWIARKLARSQISSFSVCEGLGRTLKGRDLSKMRNAILTKTGFLE